MDCTFAFAFEDKTYSAEAFFSIEEEPCYVFVFFKKGEVVAGVYNEVTIETDFENLLPRDDDHYPKLLLLRKSIFEVIRITPEFLQAKQLIPEKTGEKKTTNHLTIY